MSLSTERVVTFEAVQPHVVLVNPVPGCDMRRGEADDLAELTDRLTLADRLDGHFVPAQDALAGGEPRSMIALIHEVDSDDDVVAGGKADGTRRCHLGLTIGFARMV